MAYESIEEDIFLQGQADSVSMAESYDSQNYSGSITVSTEYNVVGYDVTDRTVNISTGSTIQGENNSPPIEDVRNIPNEFFGMYYETNAGFAAEESEVGNYNSQSPEIKTSHEEHGESSQESTILQDIQHEKLGTEQASGAFELGPAQRIDSATSPDGTGEVTAPVSLDAPETLTTQEPTEHEGFLMVNHVNEALEAKEEKALQEENDTSPDQPSIIEHNAPEITVNNTTVSENIEDGTIIGYARAFDADTGLGDKLTYSITGGNNGAFAIDANSGAIMVVDSTKLISEEVSVHSLQITVTDGIGLSDTKSMSINITDFYTEISGTSGMDNITGTSANERIFAGDNPGYEWVYGGQGDDTIYGEGGMDLLVGDTNTPTSSANVAGDDRVYGGEGNDYVIGDVACIMLLAQVPQVEMTLYMGAKTMILWWAIHIWE